MSSDTVAHDLRARTMLDLLRHRAEVDRERTAYIFLSDDGVATTSLTFGQLDSRARAIAGFLEGQVAPGERALLVYPAGLDFITAFFGCLYAGVVAVPATYPKPRRPLPRMSRIAEDSGARIALTTAITLETLDLEQQDAIAQNLTWVATDEIADRVGRNWRAPTVNSDDLAFLQYTSGSTSDPKGVMVSHGNLLSNLEAIRQAFGIEPIVDPATNPTGVFWLPAYHDMGLIGGILTPLYVGGRSVLMSPSSFLQRPLRWLKAIDEYGASISGAPNFAYDYCLRRVTATERANLDLHRWRLAFCGAEPIRAETIRGFCDAFAPAGFLPEAFFPCYGLAESTLLVTGADHRYQPTVIGVNRTALAEHRVEVADRHDKSHMQELVGCGTPAVGHSIAIVDPVTCIPCPPRTVGEILVHGPSVTRGYWQRPEESAAEFVSDVPGIADKMLRTGDLGFIHEGQLYVTGRVKDVIIIRGRNHYPQDIEQTCEEAHPGVLPGAAFSVNIDDEERLVVVHQVDRSCPKEEYGPVVQAIRREIAEKHELEPAVIQLIRQTSLPITSSGKVQRQLCREQYLQGELKVLHEWKLPARAAAANGNGQMNVRGNRVFKSNGQSNAHHTTGMNSRFGANLGAIEIDRVVERIESWLQEWLVERVGLDPADILRDKPFAEFGVDSLTAVELSHELEKEFGVPLPPIVAWNYPTPAALARYLAEQSTGAASAPVAESNDSAELESLLAEIEHLSDDEAASLLSDSGR
jgi:acyl-CoA synthetase (AMP-forming)/AMP-acid ligase II/acyl carrier protein